MNFTPFDRNLLKIKPLSERVNDLDISVIKPLKETEYSDEFKDYAKAIIKAKSAGSSIIFMMGGHVIRSGVQNYIIDLIKKGFITCVSMNGSVMIHDFEFALIGETTESVSKYIKEGQFGLWKETGAINDIINNAYSKGFGMGESVGKAILEGEFPYKDFSILASAHKYQIPATVHVGIGYDIIHEHPNCDGAATGATSYRDFLYFTKAVENLEGGVVMNFGSAVMAPEVFLKALSMARNVANQKEKSIKNFTSIVGDIRALPTDITKEPPKENPCYYFRPLKTMLIRTINDGGKSFYINGMHDETIPSLWTAIIKEEQNEDFGI